ncbi:MAG: succinate dehydrogenase, hydrophobic membrane anchor protein [Proteobacteria bacterium]|nr:succinate dehydrogenase, hydrophobic membrane anchor protein [Pseudomonadota bacterium]
MKFRSPLKNARGLGSANEGLSHWWLQRVTAVALIPLCLWFVYSVLGFLGAPHAVVVSWFGSPLNSSLMLLFVLVSLYHGQTGVQVVIEDYIHTKVLNIGLLLLVKGFSALLAVVAVVSVLKMAIEG